MSESPRKKIVLLSPFFYPENISTGKYNTGLVKELVKNDADIHVICSHPLYPDWKTTVSDAKIPGIKIKRGGRWVFYPKQVVLRRLILEVWFSVYSMMEIVKIRNEIDCVIAIFPPTLFMLLLKPILPKSVIRIGIIHDLMGIMAIGDRSTARKMITKLIQYGEISAFNACDKLICLSESMRDIVHQKYNISKSKLIVQHPFVSISNEEVTTNRLSSYFPKQYRHIVYSGALGEKQIPSTLIEFYKKLCANNENIMCHIFSRGPMFEDLSKNSNSSFADRIQFHDLVDEVDLPELYAKSTVQIIPQASGTGAGAFPSKLPNLFAAGVPIFTICDEASELAKLINESGLGHVVSNWDITKWVSELETFITRIEKEDRKDRQIKAEKFILEKFSIQSLVKIILN